MSKFHRVRYTLQANDEEEAKRIIKIQFPKAKVISVKIIKGSSYYKYGYYEVEVEQ
jgi:hypothetical protein